MKQKVRYEAAVTWTAFRNGPPKEGSPKGSWLGVGAKEVGQRLR